MSQIVNVQGVRPGVIYRIALENFLTYKQVELYPGTSLNLIIGPNGTGKSSFVCAIILGLCGKTSAIGRAKNISEYIRSGCQEATIEIELYQSQRQRNVIVTRHIDLSGVSNWYINKKIAREKQVQDLVASLNIHVDNLCQLLPQDRVQDFSKMDPRQLLRSTLAAVGGQESMTKLDELVKIRNQHRQLSTTKLTNAQTLAEFERLNERLKADIDAMKQRHEIEQQILICEKKKLWLEYQELREKVLEYNNDKKETEKLVTSHSKKMTPLQQLVEKTKNDISSLEKQMLKSNRETHILRDKVTETLDAIRALDYALSDEETSYKEKLERHKHRQMEIVEAKAKLDKLSTDRDRVMQEVGDATHVKMELSDLHKQMSKTNAAIDRLKKEKLNIQYEMEHNITPQMRQYQNSIRRLENMDEKRLEVLRQYNEDTYQALEWLRENRDMFQHPVYEPMMLQINFTDPKFARYLESTVPARDLIAFTFESTQDMNLFLQKVRVEKGLRRVNAICSQDGRVNQAPNDIQQLSYLGFYTYLVDTITGPDVIIRYLCKQYNIHKVPIGNDHTYNNSGKVPANISFFFTENHRITVRVSAYSGISSSTTQEIRPPKLLALTVDVEQVNMFQNKLSELEKTASSNELRMNEFNGKLDKLESNLNTLSTRRKHVSDGMEKVKMISVQLRMQKTRLEEIENEPSLNIDQEQQKCRTKQRDFVLKQCALQADLTQVMDSLLNNVLNRDMSKVKLDFYRNAIVQQESELRELKTELRNVQVTLENIQRLLARAKSSAKEKLEEAKLSCDGKMPQDPDFPYKEDFDILAGSISALQEHCVELQTRVNCLDKGDEQIILEYENREKLIMKLRNEISQSSDINQELEARIDSLKAEWLPPLEKLMCDINKAFGEMFAKLDCAGEIALEKAGGDDDYEKYGISILVSFRASEQLQQLTRHSQSGGERALSTAVYLMALQRLTTVPFRCVDEINQGMDPINERKMFQLLVKVTTDTDNAQYFLFTPKLLMNLQYNDKIMVHTIMNGPKIMKYKEWQYDEFVARARNFRP